MTGVGCYWLTAGEIRGQIKDTAEVSSVGAQEKGDEEHGGVQITGGRQGHVQSL